MLMAPAAREVGVLTPVTAAARAVPSPAAPVAAPSADAPVAAPTNPGNDLMAAIRARSDGARPTKARPARRPARRPPRGHPRAPPLADAAALASQAREGRRAGGAGRRPRGDPGAENKAEAAPGAGRERADAAAEDAGAAGPEPAVGLLRGHKHACGAGQGAGGGLRLGVCASLRLKVYS